MSMGLLMNYWILGLRSLQLRLRTNYRAISGQAPSLYPQKSSKIHIKNSETGVSIFFFASLSVLFSLTFTSLVGPDISMVTYATTHCYDD
jgi:hypothetical protein